LGSDIATNGRPTSRDSSQLFHRHRRARYGFVLGAGTPESNSAPQFAGSDPVAQLIVERSGASRRWDGRRWCEGPDDPLEAIEDFVEASRARATGLPSNLAPETALPRTVGYLAYELGAFIEDVPRVTDDGVGLPLAVLSTYDEIHAADDSGSVDTIRFVTDGTADPVPAGAVARIPTSQSDPNSHDGTIALDAYGTGFSRISQAIRVGRIYQANLTRRLILEYDGDAFDLWGALNTLQPVPYAAFLDFGSAALLGNSPERFLQIRGERISTCPIKGTRPRSDDRADDEELARELSVDAKEAAEHVMIVDLERNDLGRLCRPSSVTVERLASIASFATLHHLESEVRGTLRPDAGLAEILRATFPGGSITGAPKVMAMEIIAEVEPEARGVYTGAVGSFNGGRQVDLNIAIRTAIAADGRIHYGVGGGIVADSRMERELDETRTKARALIEAIAATKRDNRMRAL
jgi:para-aminobenzoate synthetase component 1